MHNKFRGTGVAIITPFHNEGSIDFKSFEKVIDFQIDNNVDFLVFMGTTGEAVTLNDNERNAIISFAVEIVNGRVPVVIGTGGNNTQKIVNTIKSTDFTGVDAILSVSPYYNKPQQDGIYNHYKTIASVSPVPVILYNVPGRTGSNMDAETTLKIAHELSNVIAIKEASKDLDQISRIIKEKPAGFLVISGDDLFTLPMLAIGGDGVISVTANVFPAEFSAMVRYGLNGDFGKARNIHLGLVDIAQALFAGGSPSGVKAALAIKGMCKNALRLPLVKVQRSVYNQISAILEKIDKAPLSK